MLIVVQTTGGTNAFSPKLNEWVRSGLTSSSLDLLPGDPMLASQTLYFVGGRQQQRGAVIPRSAGRSVDLSWFERAVQPAAAPLKPADVMPVIAGLTDLLRSNYFEEIDSLLKSFPVRIAAPEMMVAMLRTTFPLRRKPLRSWPKLLRAVRKELKARQIDADSVLLGLS